MIVVAPEAAENCKIVPGTKKNRVEEFLRRPEMENMFCSIANGEGSSKELLGPKVEKSPPHAQQKQIHLVRHGESSYNVHYAVHQSDPMRFDAPLTELGCSQADDLRAQLAPLLRVAALSQSLRVVSSPLTRALDTAVRGLEENVLAGCERTVTGLCAERLEASCDLGSSVEELAQRFPHFEAELRQLEPVWWYSPDGKESVEASRIHFRDYGFYEHDPTLSERVERFVELLRGMEEDVIVVFGHSDFTNCLLERHFDQPDVWSDNCEIISLTL